MHLEGCYMAYKITKNKLKNGDTIYYINQVSRVPGTKNKHKQVMVEKFSANELILEGKDPESYVNDKMSEYKEAALEEVKSLTYTVDLTKKLTLSNNGDLQVVDDSKNLGFLAYSTLYHQLELDEFINNRRRYLDCTFNINVIFQHLLYSRLLWPASKKKTWEHKEKFFGDTDYDIQHVYRTLDPLLKWRTDFLKHLDRKIKEQYGRRNTVVFYDVTNYYFEIDEKDEEDGLRNKGVSKEHRPNPIIQMGLFMDELGLPITYELFRGNTNDCSTLANAMDECIIDFSTSKKIVVADKGMMSYYNILKIRNDHNGYVISQSIRKSDEDTVAFALNDKDWKELKDEKTEEVIYKIKERTIPRTARSYGDVDNSKHSGSYNERQVFIWSKKYADRAKHDRQDAIDKAHEATGKKSKDFKDSCYGKNKYLIKKPLVNGETVDADEFEYIFDENKLKEEEKLDGYYIICTNVVGTDKINEDCSPDKCWYKDGFLTFNRKVSAQEIVDIYGGLWKIEETFKVSKTGMLNLRPVFHSKQDRIRAHFLLCFISLVLERLLEFRMNWKYSSKQIQESLSSFSAVQMDNSNIYQISYYDIVIKEILTTLGIDVDRKFLLQSDIRRIVGKTKKKIYEQ